MRFLFATLALLVVLAVPVAAAVFSSAKPAVAHAEPSKAATDLWISDAPPPQLIMLLGTLVIVVTVMRHLRTRRSPLTLNAEFLRGPSMTAR